MSTPAERLARNEILFREVNERLDDLADRGAGTTDYLCECSELACVERVELTGEEYERARSRPAVFVVRPGHERPAIERVVEENERFLLVEKIVALDAVAETDPRSNEQDEA